MAIAEKADAETFLRRKKTKNAVRIEKTPAPARLKGWWMGPALELSVISVVTVTVMLVCEPEVRIALVGDTVQVLYVGAPEQLSAMPPENSALAVATR